MSHVFFDNGAFIIRYNENSGESYSLGGGAWKKVKELESIPASKYKVIVGKKENSKTPWPVAIRIDLKTGKGWWYSNESWKPQWEGVTK